MGRKQDAAPIGQTCPKIDDIISTAQSWYNNSEDISRREFDIFEKKMEEIRSANSTLREWGNEEYYRASELEKELDYAKGEADSLKDEIKSLKEEIRSLEREISQAEH